ncbi:33566_t:CDS:2, partial [Gigaspora margarita]
ELPGHRKLFNSENMVILKQLVHKKVDWYLDELVYEIEKMTGKRSSLHKAAQERNERARSSFIAKIVENYTHDQLIFLDKKTAFSSIKAWIKRYRDFFDSSDDPVYALEVACTHITNNMTNAFFNASIYSE